MPGRPPETEFNREASESGAPPDLETDDEENMEEEDTDRSRDQETSFNISVESVSEEYGHCSQLIDEVRHQDHSSSIFYLL